LVAVLAVGPCGGCGSRPAGEADRLSFLVLAGEKSVWSEIADRFRAETGMAVELVEGPNATDLRENLYATSLMARDDSFDLVYMDVTWTPKFAGAGWLSPLDEAFTKDELDALLEAPLEAGRYRGRLYRVPVRTDVGLLYVRRDLLERAGLAAPESFDDLSNAARTLQSPPEMWGYLWQGSQYEGLVCVFLEVLRGHGGFWVDPKTLDVGLDRPEAIAALDFLRRCRTADAISPPGVTTLKEDDSRRLFQSGRAVFLRNWTYVWKLAQAPGSPVKDRVAATPMVHLAGIPATGTLGGWGFGISRYSRHAESAVRFVRFAISLTAQRILCAKTGYWPARREAYSDPELLAANPFLAEAGRLNAVAVARPSIPRYALASDILARHLSAALSGLVEEKKALDAAARETRLLLSAGKS
jgi:multiple sugar transport system substrate-binding protein